MDDSTLSDIVALVSGKGLGAGALGLLIVVALKLARHVFAKFNNTEANLSADVKAIHTQQILNDNLTKQIQQLMEQLENERNRADSWHRKYYQLLHNRKSSKADDDADNQ